MTQMETILKLVASLDEWIGVNCFRKQSKLIWVVPCYQISDNNDFKMIITETWMNSQIILYRWEPCNKIRILQVCDTSRCSDIGMQQLTWFKILNNPVIKMYLHDTYGNNIKTCGKFRWMKRDKLFQKIFKTDLSRTMLSDQRQ